MIAETQKEEQQESRALVEVEAAVEACNAVAVPDQIKAALVRDLKPIADKLGEYRATAAAIEVFDKTTANSAAAFVAVLESELKAVKSHEIISAVTDGLHKLHRRWTGLREMFIGPLDESKRTVRGKILEWQEAERRKAEEVQRKLQAEADLKAARERAKAEAEAQRQREIEAQARRKAEDARRAAAEANDHERARLEAEARSAERKAQDAAIKADAKQDIAATVIAPTVTVEAPKSGIRAARRWKVARLVESEFYAALATRSDLRGFVKIETTRLERAKAANPNMEVPGIDFAQVVM